MLRKRTWGKHWHLNNTTWDQLFPQALESSIAVPIKAREGRYGSASGGGALSASLAPTTGASQVYPGQVP